jgi:hypothetical protein
LARLATPSDSLAYFSGPIGRCRQPRDYRHTKRAEGALPYAEGMLIASAGMLVYCLVSLYLIERLHALLGSILAWLAWFK